ncbi:MAG TPA: pyridoxamine 5'-phosphate oxidase family protein [Acidimicrobiales bacterium]|nr:pyridoxamine 5'-phosphate oxidase family protein [Acidimicrobiales bacterium]
MTSGRLETISKEDCYAGCREAIVAFQVDDFDVEARRGWSVLVVGPSNEVTQSDEVMRVTRRLDDGWVPGEPDHVLCITPHRVSGRRMAGYS